MTRWIIPAPVWEREVFQLGNIAFGWVEECDGEWFSGCHNGTSTIVKTHSEARAWVEAEVLRAFGAEVAND